MAPTILVTYATKYGSTQEAAKAIAGTLCQAGGQVEILPARQVRSLDGYNAVVLGAALYMGRWHEDARHFLKRHRARFQAGRWRSSRLARSVVMRRSGKVRAHSSTRRWPKLPGSCQSPSSCLAASSTQRNSTFHSTTCPLGTRGTGRLSRPGRAHLA